MNRVLAFALLVVLIAVPIAEAQEVDPPPRVTPPLRSQGTTSSLQVRTNVFGGYDVDLAPADLQQAPGVVFDRSNFRGWGSANLLYSLDSDARALTLGAGATANTTRNRTTTGPVYGTNANVGFRTSLGRRTTFSISESAARRPYYVQGLFASLPPGSYSPDSNPINAIVDGHLWTLGSSASLGYTMTRRTIAGFRYSYDKSRQEGAISGNFSYHNQLASVNIGQQISQSTSIQASYRAGSYGGTQASLQYDSLSQGFSMGVAISRRIGPTRTLVISAGGGADSVDMGMGRYWQPAYYASFGTDIARSWSLVSNYTQTSSILNSPLSAPDSYLNQSLSFSAGGSLSRSLNLTVFTAASRGDVAASQSLTGSSGSYLGLNSGAQLNARLAGGWSAVFGANYYRSHLRGAAQQLQTSSGIYQRSSVRIGLAWNAPLLGSGRRPRAPRR